MAAEKASRKVTDLSELLRNLRGSREAVRRVSQNVSTSVPLYEAPVWSHAAKIPYRRVEIAQLQRNSALRCVRARRAVSTEAVCLLTRTMRST